jgi:transposase
VISGPLHLLKSGCGWRDCPQAALPRSRWRIEAASVASRDFRRVATRYDKLNFLSAIVLAAIIAFWV